MFIDLGCMENCFFKSRFVKFVRSYGVKQNCLFSWLNSHMAMDKLFAIKKCVFLVLIGCIAQLGVAQEKNLQQATEENFRYHYKTELYKQFPTFPRYINTGDRFADEKDFEARCWSWIKTHPEYNAFLVSKMDRNPQFNTAGLSVQPVSTGKGGDGITPKIQK